MLKISEYEFGDIVLNSTEIQKLIKTNHFLVAREFKVDSAVPDFVLISHKGFEDIQSLSQKYPAEAFRGLSSSLISMLYSPARIKDLDLIASANFTDTSSVIKVAKKLHELEVVNLNLKKNTISRNKSFLLPRVDVVSLELKLDKWKKALWQASRNQAYYAKSYVVMPSDKADVIKQNIGYFDVNGVSAVVVDTTKGGIRFISRPKTTKNQGLTTQRLAGLSYLMQNKDSFSEVTL